MIKPTGILHFTLPVSDLDRSTAFYTGVLGCEVLTRSERMSFMQAGDDYFILAKSEVPLHDANAPGSNRVHHAFTVEHDAFDAAIESLEAQGVEIRDLEHRKHGAFTGRQFYFRDPDDNVLEIIAFEGRGPGF